MEALLSQGSREKGIINLAEKIHHFYEQNKIEFL